MPDKEYIDEVKSYYSEEVLQSAVSLIEMANEARAEMIKKGIEANTILINPRIAYVNGFDIATRDIFFSHPTVEHFPPMILGMEAFIAAPGEMPPKVGLIVTHKDCTAIDAIRKEAKNELIKELKEMSFRDVCDMLYGDEFEDFWS